MNEGLEKLKEIHELITYPITESSIVKIKDNIAIIERTLKEHEKYKAIEEELGIDLLTLFKISKYGFYHKSSFINIKTHRIDYSINYCDYAYIYYVSDTKEWCVGTIHTTLNIKDYGKTWALTREELEK